MCIYVYIPDDDEDNDTKEEKKAQMAGEETIPKANEDTHANERINHKASSAEEKFITNKDEEISTNICRESDWIKVLGVRMD